MSWGSQPGGHCLLIFYVVIICTPFRPQIRPLDRERSPRDCSCGPQWGGSGEVCRQATLTKIFLLKALILAVWIHHWKTAMLSILRSHVPYVSLCCCLFCCGVWRVETKTKHPGTGLSVFKSLTFTNCVIVDKWLNLCVFVSYPWRDLTHLCNSNDCYEDSLDIVQTHWHALATRWMSVVAVNVFRLCSPAVWKEHWVMGQETQGPVLALTFMRLHELEPVTWSQLTDCKTQKQVFCLISSTYKWNWVLREEEAHPKSTGS